MTTPAGTLTGLAGPVMVCRVAGLKGSGPRETGAFMFVSAGGIDGTIGGGHLEHVTIAHARAMLEEGIAADRTEIVLGPETGQCCGGRVSVQIDLLNEGLAADLAGEQARLEKSWPHVLVFGAGHVGRALIRALEPLPLMVSVSETRVDELALLESPVTRHLAALPESLVPGLPAGSAVVILTHDHALDFLIARAALSRPDLAYVGMIGSATKRGVFSHWLHDHDGTPDMLDRLVMPIGGGRLADKTPEVIAALVAAELLEALLPRR